MPRVDDKPVLCLAVPFWVDQEYDRAYASDGVSRFGAYVRDRLRTAFAECWEGSGDDASFRRASFAAAAWRTATGPVMSPGYVRHESPVLGSQVEGSQWDGSLIAVVQLVAPRPAALTDSFDWRGGLHWRDWPRELRADGYDFVDPTERDVATYPFLRTSLQLSFPVPVDRLPMPPVSPDGDVEALASEAVADLVDELNRRVGPVLDALDGGCSR